MNCEMCDTVMSLEDYDFCDICSDCLDSDQQRRDFKEVREI